MRWVDLIIIVLFTIMFSSSKEIYKAIYEPVFYHLNSKSFIGFILEEDLQLSSYSSKIFKQGYLAKVSEIG